MNVKTLGQEDITNMFREYHDIAFPGLGIWQNYSLQLFIDYLKSIVNDGYRLGIQGWPHTKLKIITMPDGRLKFWIYPNGENFTTEQNEILKKLVAWAEKLSNEH